LRFSETFAERLDPGGEPLHIVLVLQQVLRLYLKVLRDTFIGSLKNSLLKWFFKATWFERFFEGPEMVP